MGKAMKPKIMVFEYLNSQQVYPHYRLGHEVAERPDLWMYNTTGGVCTAGNGHWIFPDFAKQEAQDVWYNSVVNVSRTGFIDGAFIDGCAADIGGCPEHTPGRQVGKLAMLTKLQRDIPGPLICGSSGVVIDGSVAHRSRTGAKAAIGQPARFQCFNVLLPPACSSRLTGVAPTT